MPVGPASPSRLPDAAAAPPEARPAAPTDLARHRETRSPSAPRFTWTELSGSLGDLGLFVPLVVAMTLAVGLDLGVVLVAAGVMNVLTGWLFRQPIPVQPMKAIAAVAIAEGMSKGALAAAGLLMGVILLAAASLKFVDVLQRLVPKALVRGIQLGVGLKLAAKGVAWIGALPIAGWNSILVAVSTAGVLLFLARRRIPGLLPVFVAGFLLLYLGRPSAYDGLAFSLPELSVQWPTLTALSEGFLHGTLPQLPLTLLNSVIAVCALSAVYFPGRGIAPQRMAASVGLMNLCGAPFGAIPMCHGAGGLAAQYRFGARTGGSVILLGTLKVAVGLTLGGTLLHLLGAYPASVLGTLLVFAGVELARSARDLDGRRAVVVAAITAIGILAVNTTLGFLLGLGAYLAVRRRPNRTPVQGGPDAGAPGRTSGSS